MSKVFWGLAPEDATHALTTGPEWDGSKDMYGNVVFAVNDGFGFYDCGFSSSAPTPRYAMGSDSWVVLEKRPYSMEKAEESKPARSKYHREIKKGIFVDVYDVLSAFNVTNPADQHAIKKMLAPGKRGVKDGIQDREEAVASLKRAIELENEQEDKGNG